MKVFVSSTYDDLADYRQEVLGALIRCEHIYHGMEFFGASSKRTLDYCRSQIEMAELVICIVGTRYGTRSSAGKKSYTEQEIKHAFKHGRPVHAYFLDYTKQRVLPVFVDSGEDRNCLEEFKQYVSKRVMPAFFTSPENLALNIVHDLRKFEECLPGGVKSVLRERTVTRYRETAYDRIAEWYDHWYAGHWSDDEPFNTLRKIISEHLGPTRNPMDVAILDTACGTGNPYVAFSRTGHDIQACDGSLHMLQKAIKNCERAGVSTNGLVPEPVNWTDTASFERIFEKQQFDVIVNTANSFCHVPGVVEYMDRALRNFYDLLAPGGLLIIDTKKYISDGHLHGWDLYKELRLLDSEWIVRTTREETAEIPDLGTVSFHTTLHYDIDKAFSEAVPRALIVLTVYGEALPPETQLIPYYPLPAFQLAQRMEAAGFRTTSYPAKEGITAEWKYDVVVGTRPID